MKKEKPKKIEKILSSHSQNFKDKRIFSNLQNIMKRFSHIKTVFIYVSKKGEPDTLSLIEKFKSQRITTVVPFTDQNNKRIIPKLLGSMHELKTGSFGILEPKKAPEFNKSEIDMFIIPGTRFDTSLNRKGHGYGYFDRFLADVKGSKPIIGLSYEKNIVDNLPAQHWDIPMDVLISEKRIIMDKEI